MTTIQRLLPALLLPLFCLAHTKPAGGRAVPISTTGATPIANDYSDTLQQLINDAATTGATVQLNAGTFSLTKTILIPAGVTLTGAGMGANANTTPYNGTILSYTGSGTAIQLTGTNSSISNLTIYNPGGTATCGLMILADSQLVESVSLSRLLLYGFTGGTAVTFKAIHHGGIAYCSSYDLRIRHAKKGIWIQEGDVSSFVNSNSFFHGVISGGGFDYCLLVDGGNNNVFYGTIAEPYSSTYGHIVVDSGQIIGENIRIEAAQQPANTPVIYFAATSAQSRLTGVYGGGPVINLGNNTILFATANFTGEKNPGYNQLVNSAFLLPATNGLPAFWSLSNAAVTVTYTTEQAYPGQKVIQLKVPPGIACDLSPTAGYGPTPGTDPLYTYANFNTRAKTTIPGVVKLTYNYTGGLVSSAAHTGSGNWETIGLQVLTDPSTTPAPKINLNNSARSDTLTVFLTAPSFSFGNTVPQRDPSVITSAGGILTGTLSNGVAASWSFISGTNYLVLPKNGNIFTLNGSSLTISRINYLTADRFPSGTLITLLFNSSGNTVQNSAYINLKSTFTTTAANTSLTLLSSGDGTWREVNRNN